MKYGNIMQKVVYRKLLENVEASKYRNRSQSLSCFSAQKGKLYNNNVMFVGRAVNGWGSKFKLENIDSNLLIDDLFPSIPNDDCPLEWVEESWGNSDNYNTKKSAFWRVTKQISEDINGTDSSNNWSSKVIWSNLYKIAPSETGNPSDSLCNSQFAACNELLETEIREFKPKYIVFLTGYNWFDGFLSESINLKKTKNTRWVEAEGTLNFDNEICKIVVAKHPQGKPEFDLVTEVMDSLIKV
jgi:hypothetical protein